MPSTQTDKAAAFEKLHAQDQTFVMGNAFDGASARMLAAIGFEAIATSSGVHASLLGRHDGSVNRSEALAHAKQIVEATDLPVSADLENGFGDSPQDVATTIQEAGLVGLVGGSIEDATSDSANPIYDLDLAVTRIEAAVVAANGLPFSFTLTARCENYVRGIFDLDDTIARLQTYEAAGADVLMAPGLPDLDSVQRVCSALHKPVNFMVGIPGRSFTVADLAAAGVKRISLATSLYNSALAATLAAAREIMDNGTFGYLERGLPGSELAAFLKD